MSFATWTEPLYKLTRKSSEPFVWTEEANNAFHTLKIKLTKAPVLAYPDMDSRNPLIVIVDTSSYVTKTTFRENRKVYRKTYSIRVYTSTWFTKKWDLRNYN